MNYIVYDKKLISLLIKVAIKYQSNFYIFYVKNKTLMNNALESVSY